MEPPYDPYVPQDQKALGCKLHWGVLMRAICSLPDYSTQLGLLTMDNAVL